MINSVSWNHLLRMSTNVNDIHIFDNQVSLIKSSSSLDRIICSECEQMIMITPVVMYTNYKDIPPIDDQFPLIESSPRNVNK